MKKVVAILAMMMVLAGCRTANCFVSASASPKKGEVYELQYRTLKVVQVCDGFVHVMHWNWFKESYNGLRIAVIPLESDYVTDSYLRPGKYEYMGPVTYETVKGDTNTIRLFKEVGE